LGDHTPEGAIQSEQDEIRFAAPDEGAALEALQWRASLFWEEYRKDLLAHPDAIEVARDAIRRRQVRVLERSGRVAGFSVVLRLAAGVAELDGLFVEPEFMRQGVGRLLVEDAARAARAAGLRRIEVTANPRAVGFYRRLGFVRDGTVATRFGPGVRMHLDLASGH
jgi:ribosomal protein S18 acetylase RimI-like enzyme